MPNEERANYMRDLRARILAHPGRAAAERWDSIRLVHAALQWNEQMLLEFIDFSGPDGQLRAVQTVRNDDGQRHNLRQFWLFLFLFLANYTAMNATLIDHVRGLMSDYRDTEFAKEEENRRVELGAAPVTRFMKDLRNYISHISAPSLNLQMEFQQGGPLTFVARLNVKELLESNRMTAASKEYLRGRETVVILDAVQEYASLREVYYTWLFAQFDLLHGAEVGEHNQLVDEQDAFYGHPPEEPASTTD